MHYTNNTELAAKVIYDTLSGQYGDFRTPTDAVKALADAGLLAPDLPKPTIIHDDGRPEWEMTSDVDLWVTVREGSIWMGEKPLHPLIVETLSNNLRAALVELFRPIEEEN